MIKITVPVTKGGAGRWQVKYTDAFGVEHRKQFNDKAVAEAESKKIAKTLEDGKPAALDAVQAVSFRKAVEALFGTSTAVHEACADYANARRISPGRTMVELATLVAQQNQVTHTVSTLTVKAAVDQYLESCKLRDLSGRTYGGKKSLLFRFVKAFPCSISHVMADAVQTWVLNIPKTNGRTRNNYLAGIKEFFSQGGLKTLPQTEAILALPESKETPVKKYIWKPSEFRSMMEMALLPFTPERKDKRKYLKSHLRVLPFLAIGGLAGARNESEIMHLSWEDIKLDDSMITIMSKKTGDERIIPLPDSAVAWLRCCPDRQGRLWTFSADTLHKDLGELAGRCGLKWKQNALRKSRITYEMMLTGDNKAAAKHAGNSTRMISKNYLAAKQAEKSEAVEWFEIMPPVPAENIIKASFGG